MKASDYSRPKRTKKSTQQETPKPVEKKTKAKTKPVVEVADSSESDTEVRVLTKGQKAAATRAANKAAKKDESDEETSSTPVKRKAPSSESKSSKKSKVEVPEPGEDCVGTYPSVEKWVKKYVLNEALSPYQHVIAEAANKLMRRTYLAIKNLDTTPDKISDEDLYRLVMELQWSIVQWPRAFTPLELPVDYVHAHPISIFHSDAFRAKTIATFRKDL